MLVHVDAKVVVEVLDAELRVSHVDAVDGDPVKQP